uniref:Uncharacterized protein n=1 Tax=Meloidogyne enterolobii TaxID=390850 RepID=A0A6V7WVE1_MELEN|nr:unnamed protein product [Meloidogyne enterolobii]
MAVLDDDYDDRKLRNERKLAEYYKIRMDSEIKQAETDELHNIIEEEMSELDEIQRKIDAKIKNLLFGELFGKELKKLKKKLLKQQKKENETTKEPESEIINVTERLSNIGNDNLKQREELFNNASKSSKTDPSAQNENDEQQLFDSKMLELNQITTNNNIRKAIVEEDFNFIRKQRAEYSERFKKLDAENKKTVWGNVCKVAKGIKGHVIETTSEYLDFSAGSVVYVENRKNDTTKQPESEIGNETEKLSKIENIMLRIRRNFCQGTSKQNDVEVNNSQHEENVPIIDQEIPGTVGNILINQNFTGLNLKDKLDKADELLNYAREADKKIEKEEEHIKQNREILNNIGATIEKMEQEKNKPGLSNKFIDGARTFINYGIDTAKHIFDTAYKWANKTFSRATFSMGIKQRTRHRTPKEDANGPSNAEPKPDEPKPSNAEPKPDEKTKSNDIPKNTAQTRNKNDDDASSSTSYNPPNNSNGFAKAVIAGAAVGAVAGGIVGGLPGALFGGAVGAATGAIVYACDAVVKTCDAVNNVINNVKNGASSFYNTVKEGFKSAWNWVKGWFS